MKVQIPGLYFHESTVSWKYKMIENACARLGRVGLYFHESTVYFRDYLSQGVLSLSSWMIDDSKPSDHDHSYHNYHNYHDRSWSIMIDHKVFIRHTECFIFMKFKVIFTKFNLIFVKITLNMLNWTELKLKFDMSITLYFPSPKPNRNSPVTLCLQPGGLYDRCDRKAWDHDHSYHSYHRDRSWWILWSITMIAVIASCDLSPWKVISETSTLRVRS